MAEAVGGGSRDGLGQIEEGDIFFWAKVAGAEEFLQTDNLGPFRGSSVDLFSAPGEIFFRILNAAHLNESYADCPVTLGRGWALDLILNLGHFGG